MSSTLTLLECLIPAVIKSADRIVYTPPLHLSCCTMDGNGRQLMRQWFLSKRDAAAAGSTEHACTAWSVK